jgi:hypothetical protein
MEPDIITKCRLNGETVYSKEGKYNPIKTASVEPKQEEISSWARLHQIQEHESKNIKSASTQQEPQLQLSSWARLHRLGSAN